VTVGNAVTTDQTVGGFPLHVYSVNGEQRLLSFK